MTDAETRFENSKIHIIKDSGFWISLLCPIIGIVYYAQVNHGFLLSMTDVVESADIERDLYLTPRSGLPNWGDHYFYRFVADIVSLLLATFICGGLTRTRGRLGGILGGLGVSALMAYLIFVSIYSPKIDLGTGHIIVTIATMMLSPIIGAVAGGLGEEYSNSQVSGFAGIPRLHFIWMWLPLYFYSLALISPISRLYFQSDPFSIISHLIHLVPILVYGAPLYIGLAIMSGNILSKAPSFVRQIIGPIVLVGGVVAIGYIQISIKNYIS